MKAETIREIYVGSSLRARFLAAKIFLDNAACELASESSATEAWDKLCVVREVVDRLLEKQPDF